MKSRPVLTTSGIVFASVSVVQLALELNSGWLQYAPVEQLGGIAIISTLFTLPALVGGYLYYNRDVLRRPLGHWRGDTPKRRVVAVCTLLILSLVTSGAVGYGAVTVDPTDPNAGTNVDGAVLTKDVSGPVVESTGQNRNRY